jgi:hypothetical protein
MGLKCTKITNDDSDNDWNDTIGPPQFDVELMIQLICLLLFGTLAIALGIQHDDVKYFGFVCAGIFGVVVIWMIVSLCCGCKCSSFWCYCCRNYKCIKRSTGVNRSTTQQSIDLQQNNNKMQV